MNMSLGYVRGVRSRRTAPFPGASDDLAADLEPVMTGHVALSGALATSDRAWDAEPAGTGEPAVRRPVAAIQPVYQARKERGGWKSSPSRIKIGANHWSIVRELPHWRREAVKLIPVRTSFSEVIMCDERFRQEADSRSGRGDAFFPSQYSLSRSPHPRRI